MRRFTLLFVLATLWLAMRSPSAQAQSSLTDLGTLGATNSYTNGINAAGQVVGWSDTSEWDPDFGYFHQHAFLWRPNTPNGTTGTMVDLGVLGGVFSEATAINDTGQVVGMTNMPSGGDNAYLWTPNVPNGTTGTMIALGTLDGWSSEARAINASMQVVGWSYTATNAQHAFLWTPGAMDGVPGNPQMKDLGTLGGSSSVAYGINSTGRVVGLSSVPGDTAYHAFLWTPGGTDGMPGNLQMKDLGTLGGSMSYALGINSAGQIVGFSTLPGDPTDSTGNMITHAFLWTPGAMDGVPGNPRMKDLGTLGGSNSVAGGINDAGAVTGAAAPTGDPIDPNTLFPISRAFVWTPNVPNGTTGTMTDAGSLGGSASYAIGINAAGQLAGSSNLTGDPFDPKNYPNPIQHAFVAAPVNLNHAPTASGGKGVTTTKNTAVSITMVGSDPDNDPLTYTVVSQPANGTLSGSGANRTYTPAKNFTGSDSFTFKVNDGKADSNVATVFITVAASGGGGGGTANRAPVAKSDSATLAAGVNSITINVLANDSDPDGDPLTITSTTNGTRGTTGIITVKGLQQVTYMATGTRPKANTKDTFTYTISDGNKGTATATVTVTYK
jgi:probable HAF family extracellular repeat protein